LWLDFETTGLSLETDRVLEIGAVLTDEEGRLAEAFSAVLLCARPNGAEAFAKNGITPQEIASGMPRSEAWEALDTLCRSAQRPDGTFVLGGHNVSAFDYPMWIREDPRFFHAATGRLTPPPRPRGIVDTCTIAYGARVAANDPTRSVSLDALCDAGLIDQPHGHTALADAWRAARVFFRGIGQDTHPDDNDRIARLSRRVGGSW